MESEFMWPSGTWREGISRRTNFVHGLIEIGEGGMALDSKRGDLGQY